MLAFFLFYLEACLHLGKAELVHLENMHFKTNGLNFGFPEPTESYVNGR